MIISSSQSILEIDGLNVYPNPVQDVLTIENLSNQYHILDVRIFNELGINMQSAIMDFEQRFKKKIKLAQIPSGVYFLEVTMENGARSIVKFVKAN